MTSIATIRSKNWALFGSVEYEPTDELILRGGMRYSNDHKSGVRFGGGLLTSAKTSGDNLSWDASAIYKLTPGFSMYARAVNGRALIDGNPLPQAPKWIANWTARYPVPVSDDAELFACTGWAYRSQVRLFLCDAVEYRAKSLLEGGLRVGYHSDSAKLEVAGFVRNILNQIRVIGAIDFNNLTGFLNDPRTFGVEVKKSF